MGAAGSRPFPPKSTFQGKVALPDHCLCSNPHKCLISFGCYPELRSIRLRFSISDTGIGIDPEQCHRLFQAFSQIDASTTRKYGGSGLGLAICKRLVELMDGEIGVNSQPGQGSTFWFELPFAQQLLSRAVEASSPPEVTTHATQSQPTVTNLDGADQYTVQPLVLVAEDNPINQKLTARLLKKFGYQTQVVPNGKEAVETLTRKTYAAVLMDCQMPEMDGFEATRTIRQQESAETTPHIPIIALTANAMQGDKEKCLAAGMDDYLAKPIKPALLKATLARWISN